ncbi:sensor histidine kinase [Paenibacillus sp. GSMTC-2017]|uniref:cache domain-containing sensor histidine kinase n=1 Tax=Paenibacillus sp. GSMTC-2017 TaxID=2794350 RepID=UPI0018D8C26B|nr:sensor histidine kinase [Paenibacillus sp. GSMTC-2017]MBH5318508.1 sensor histidine kinase [Paenibacillus sp. GSMTC-2017]
MKTFREFRKNTGYLPIGYKLMLSYLVFIIILVSVNGYVTNSMYESSMRKQTETNIKGTLLQITDNVAYKTDDLVRISATMYDDLDFVYRLKQSLGATGEGFERFEYIRTKLDSASKSIGLNLRLSVYTQNETISEQYRTRSAEENTSGNEQTYDIYQLKKIKKKYWYMMLPKEEYDKTMVWDQVEEDAEEDRISMIRRIVDTTDLINVKEVGIMRFSVKISELFESVNYEKLGAGSQLLVKNSNGELIYASGLPLDGLNVTLPSTEHMVEADELNPNVKYSTIEEKMHQQNWTIVAHVPLTIIEKEAEKVRVFILIVCVLCFIIFTFAGIIFSRYFSKRITKFVSVLNAFRDGDLHKRISYRGKDEFSQIATALNGMGEDIEALIKEVYLTQLQKKEAELEMLQTQINPHFLYNTLNSINRLAKFGENEKLQKMVVELAKFYRLTLNSGRTLIPVHSEIEQSNAYLEIQKVKYGHRLEVTFDIDADIWKYETIKLIVQPFIENALKHAWSGDRIHIRIVARKEKDTILYRIIDDGLGVRQERIQEIMDASKDSETGFGIRNIHQRVQLQYGPEYGVSIFSRVGIGTSVDIRIPAKMRKLFYLDEVIGE